MNGSLPYGRMNRTFSFFFMGRWLSIDYGEKNIGLAITDHLKIIVSPLTTIKNQSDESVFSRLLEIFSQQEVEKIIVGLPLGLEGNDTKKTYEVRIFFNKLSKKTDIPIEWWDERFSTLEANDFLKKKGLNWRESKKIIDQVAAAVILTNYLENKR